MLAAVLPSGLTCYIVELICLHGEWAWETMVELARDGPHWHSIRTELLTEEILMKLNQRVYAVLACELNCVIHLLKVSLIELSFGWLHAWPHDS